MTELKSEDWVEMVALAQRGDFTQLLRQYPRQSIQYFSNLQAIAIAVPKSGDSKTDMRHTRALHRMYPASVVCGVCNRETEKHYELAYVTPEQRKVVEITCRKCADRLGHT